MKAPLVGLPFVLDNELLLAFISGAVLGFIFERAGFGSAKKLTSQFYLDDMSVFKLMFTAIVTTMTGIWLLDIAGLIHIPWLSSSPVFIYPQAVGGLLVGAGFIVGGYCPGTSLVGISNGKIDALFFALGVFCGMLLFAEFYKQLIPFYDSGAMGRQTLYGFFGIPYGAVVIMVLLMAGGGFYGAAKLEAFMKRRKGLSRE